MSNEGTEIKRTKWRGKVLNIPIRDFLYLRKWAPQNRDSVGYAKKNLRYMYKKKILINLLLIFLCSCSSNLNREIIRLDPTNEKYHTPGCREIRKQILDQKSDPSESVARGALSTYFLGAISLPALGFLEINSEEYKKSLIAELKRNCY